VQKLQTSVFEIIIHKKKYEKVGDTLVDLPLKRDVVDKNQVVIVRVQERIQDACEHEYMLD
jgi:hypothetical protein